MQVSPQLDAKFKQLVSRYPVKRSALVPMLLYAQDEYGHLSDQILEEIAERLGLQMTEVTETLSYYSMLRRKAAGKYHVQVCTNISCQLRGGFEIMAHVEKRLGVGNRQTTANGIFSLEEVECMGACSGAPAIQVNYDFYENLTPEKVDAILDQYAAGKHPAPVPVISGALHEPDPAEVRVISQRFGIRDSHTLKVYQQHEGYQALQKALKEMTPEQIIDEMKKSNLRGRGGAGFPTGMKWAFVPKDSPKPKYLVANADESEPGTSKDRPLMEMDPHALIEGMVIGGKAIGSHQGYIYVRGEYRYILDIMDRAIEEAYAAGFVGKNILGTGFDFELCTHTGAGAYECGEETALLESLEGKRGYPRIKPPFPATAGLYQCPTVVNNAETLSTVPLIIRKGGDWYSSLGVPKNGGTRLYSISGHVNRPGIYELPMGFNLNRMIFEVAGGIPNGRKLKAVLPGGSSCPLLSANECDVAMD
ncbi:MAG: NADH-quinone oxidoreductase subunit NuoE, partial [Candidatus Acidiferrales bacterium]